MIALGPRPNGIENSLWGSSNNSPRDLSSNDRVFQIETGGDRLLTVRVEGNLFYQAQLDHQITLTAGKENGQGVLCKTNN